MYGKAQYGLLKYGEDRVDSVNTKAYSPNLIDYLPYYYKKSEIMNEIQRVISEEFGVVSFNIKDIDKQLNIDTATWSLEVYEKEFGIYNNSESSYEDRREIVKAKVRGTGTVTKDMIISTAEAFSGGKVDVIEYPKEDYFVVKFIGVKGIPRNMESFKNMLENIKPAHLGYEFKYTYTTCKMLIDWNALCSDLQGITCKEVKTYEKEVI